MIKPSTEETPSTNEQDAAAYRELRKRAGANGYASVNGLIDAWERRNK